MENTAKSTGRMGQFFGVPSSDAYETVIPDKALRKALIEASIKMENMLRDGAIDISRSIVSKTEWGLEIEIEMAQPKEDKPVIFSYTYRINRVTFKDWLDDHTYLTEGPLLMFTCRGMDFIVTTDNFQKTLASIVTKYEDDADVDGIQKYEPSIVEEPVRLIVHRDVVSDQDWIVKCVVS